MAMTTGKSGGTMADINMTPMIDVLLVLLVIFMLAQPLLQMSVDVQLPIERESSDPGLPPITLEILPDGSIQLNTQPVPRAGLEARLTEVYADRPDKVLFVKALEGVTYGEVVSVLDVARGAGVEVLGAVIPSAPSADGS